MEFWKDDRAAARESNSKRRNTEINRKEDDENKKKRQVIKLLSKGEIHKAVSRITSKGVADIKNPDIRAQMERKHPPRQREIPDSIKKQTSGNDLKGLREAMLKLKRGGSPGCG